VLADAANGCDNAAPEITNAVEKETVILMFLTEKNCSILRII
jgi:hypothetical protein